MAKLDTKIEKETQRPAEGPEQDRGTADGMDRVRELLVGSKMRDYETRLQALEDKIRAELTSLTAELRTRIEAVDDYIRTEVRTLTDQLKVESDERRNAIKAIQAQGHAEHELRTKASQELNDGVQRTLRETRELVSSEARLLADKIGQTSRKLFEELGRVETTMTQAKVDKRSLAAFFGELALQIDDTSTQGTKGPHERSGGN
jgi:hypothetical protein